MWKSLPESLMLVLATVSKALNVAVMSATAFCSVFLNLIQKAKPLTLWTRSL